MRVGNGRLRVVDEVNVCVAWRIGLERMAVGCGTRKIDGVLRDVFEDCYFCGDQRHVREKARSVRMHRAPEFGAPRSSETSTCVALAERVEDPLSTISKAS